MLWLCLHFPLLPAEALGLDPQAVAIVEGQGAQRWLITPCARAAAGLPLGQALAAHPDLPVQPRKPLAEHAALRSLAHWIYRYGSPVAAELQTLEEPGRIPRALLWVEVSASLRLFGSLAALCAQLRADLAELGQVAHMALAPTRAGAALLALQGHEVPVRNTSSLVSALSSLPVQALLWPQATLEALQGMGLRRLGDLLRLPRAAFAERFGEARLLELDRLRGEAPEPLRAITPPPRFRRRFELPAEVESVEALLFPLRRLAYELQAWLRAGDTGLRSLDLVCEHAQGRSTVLHQRFLAPHRDGARLFEALRERLLREPPPEPVRGLRLHTEDLARANGGQLGLFESGGESLHWPQTLERLLARLGEEALWVPALREDYRPEAALLRATPGEGVSGTGRGQRPLWLLPQPQRLPQPPPVAGEMERIESGWWEADACRDYYVVDLGRGRAWVYQDPRDTHWYLHGWWG